MECAHFLEAGKGQESGFAISPRVSEKEHSPLDPLNLASDTHFVFVN